jgi:endonuclease/exonuclease/phosphatase family metal-dependent hydrolase
LQSTHFDDQGSVARERAAALILEAIDFELDSSPRSSCPVFLLGDLNSPVDQAAYKTIATRMYDLRTTCTATFGHCNTFTGFDGRKADLSRIDHIFGTTKAGWEGGLYAVEENHYEDGKWLSDHRLVIADVNVGKGLKPKRHES